MIDVKSIQELATLPPREEIFAKVLVPDPGFGAAAGHGPGGVGRNLAVVVDQGSRKTSFHNKQI